MVVGLLKYYSSAEVGELVLASKVLEVFTFSGIMVIVITSTYMYLVSCVVHSEKSEDGTQIAFADEIACETKR